MLLIQKRSLGPVLSDGLHWQARDGHVDAELDCCLSHCPGCIIMHPSFGGEEGPLIGRQPPFTRDAQECIPSVSLRLARRFLVGGARLPPCLT